MSGRSTRMADRSARVCALLSGGVDSAALVDRLLRQGSRVCPLYVRFGLRWERAELYWIRRLLKAMRASGLEPLAVVDAPLDSLYGSHWSISGGRVPGRRSADRAVYLPGRNVLLASYAAIFCAGQGVSTIAWGILKSNPFGDASPRFFAELGRCLSQALGRRIRLVAPLRAMRKGDVIRMAHGVPLALTYSCLQPQGRVHCGRCNKCAERARAFLSAHVSDPTIYARG